MNCKEEEDELATIVYEFLIENGYKKAPGPHKVIIRGRTFHISTRKPGCVSLSTCAPLTCSIVSWLYEPNGLQRLLDKVKECENRNCHSCDNSILYKMYASSSQAIAILTASMSKYSISMSKLAVKSMSLQSIVKIFKQKQAMDKAMAEYLTRRALPVTMFFKGGENGLS